MAFVKDALKKAKHNIDERLETQAQHKAERQAVETEAKQRAHEEYVKAYREERVKALQTRARLKAKHDASTNTGNLPKLGGFAKDAMGAWTKAGKTFLDSGQLDLSMGNLDFGFGGAFTPDQKGSRKKKKVKMWNPLDY